MVGTPFVKGQSGNPKGRPKGARNKLGEAFLEALSADFALHGAAAITACREAEPAQYLRVIASIMPKQLEVDEESTLGLLIEGMRESLGAKLDRIPQPEPTFVPEN